MTTLYIDKALLSYDVMIIIGKKNVIRKKTI